MGESPTNPEYADPRRAAERHETDSVVCDLGEVLDLSATGIRVRCKGLTPRKPGSDLGLKLKFAGGSMSLKGRVAWCRRVGLRSMEIGVQFVKPSIAVQHALESLACFGFITDDKSQTVAGRRYLRSRRKREEGQKVVNTAIPNYYKILGVENNAPLDSIKTAYRALARRYHPDVTTDEDGQAKFISIQTAYRVLSNTDERAIYDRRLAG